MIDLDAPIEPGRGLGGVAIGGRVEDLLATVTPVRVISVPAREGAEVVTIHSFGPVRTWSVRGRIEQVGAFAGYRGCLANGVGVGTTLGTALAAFGVESLASDDGVVYPPGAPGLGIEFVTEGRNAGDGETPMVAASIAVQLFVFAP